MVILETYGSARKSLGLIRMFAPIYGRLVSVVGCWEPDRYTYTKEFLVNMQLNTESGRASESEKHDALVIKTPIFISYN